MASDAFYEYKYEKGYTPCGNNCLPRKWEGRKPLVIPVTKLKLTLYDGTNPSEDLTNILLEINWKTLQENQYEMISITSYQRDAN